MAYKTVFDKAEAGFIEKKSEFIGYIAPVKTNEEAVKFIDSIKAMHRKATHNVYAYILRHDNITRYSDDGEPQGTAGVPVLDVLQKEGLTDVCVVVTRYFGGIMLGGGGLVRAYSHSCKLAVDAAKIMLMCNCIELFVSIDYNLYGRLNNILPDYEVKIISTEFTDNVAINLLVRTEFVKELEDKITDITCGQAKIIKSQEIYADFT